MELHKRKAVESSQTAADLKLHLDKYQAQLKEAQVAVAEKTGAIEQEAYKYKRMQVSSLRDCVISGLCYKGTMLQKSYFPLSYYVIFLSNAV